MLKVFIERKPQYLTDYFIYVIDENNSYSIKDGHILQTRIDPNIPIQNEIEPFLRLTSNIFEALTTAFIDHAKDNNRLDNIAKLQGKEERYKDELGFLRELIKNQFKINLWTYKLKETSLMPKIQDNAKEVERPPL